MNDKVRCPACRGAKQVVKLGGMIGTCNTCKGTGDILFIDLPKPVEVKPVAPVAELVSQVADCVPASNVETTLEAVKALEPEVKVTSKQAIYKRKIIGK